jgi:hypothetical protein
MTPERNAMELDDTRTDCEQAVAMLAGVSTMRPELRHLQALEEARKTEQLSYIQDLEILKQKWMNQP